MNHEKAGGYISRITFNNGESLDISRDDIVIFVGPNNAGKSQSLKDIYTLSEQKMPTTVISDINITKNNLPISATLEKLSEGEHRGGFTTYIVLNHRMHIYNSTDKSFLSEQYYGEYRALFVANLDTAARLTICNPPDSIQVSSILSTMQLSTVNPGSGFLIASKKPSVLKSHQIRNTGPRFPCASESPCS